jgi:hypothetical protein
MFAVRETAKRQAVVTTGLVILVGSVVRLLFIFLTPADVYSADMSAWQVVVAVLQRGYNPYQLTKFLSWPPFWMQVLFGLGRTATALHISLFQAVRAFLLVCEALAVLLTALLLTRATPSSTHRMLLIIGFALNPIAIFLDCQHCNFDILAADFVLLFIILQMSFQENGRATDWLASCLCLGFGILTKTVPLVLAPLLLVGLRTMTLRERLLGLCLLVGPAALALSVLYALAPSAVESNILAYRSFPGWFGITGLLDVANLHPIAEWYTRASSWLFAASLGLVSVTLWRRARLQPSELVLYAALLMMSVVIFGPGYGSQYIFWYLPLLVASWAFWPGSWRVALLGLAVVGTFTYIEEYGLLQSHGMLFIRMGLGGSWLQRSKDLGTPGVQSLVRLPLFIAYLALFFTGVRSLRRSLRDPQEAPA